MKVLNYEKILSEDPDILNDESNMQIGKVNLVYYPENKEDIKSIIKDSKNSKSSLTISGGRTGIVGGAIVSEGNLLSFKNFKTDIQYRKIENKNILSVDPISTLDTVEEIAYKKKLFFPPNPTEGTASIGGIIATDASGSRSYKYGSVRKYIYSIEGFFSNGEEFKFNRGEYFLSSKKSIEIPKLGKIILKNNFPLIIKKNVAGYHLWENIDIIDVLCGSEGTLAIFTKCKIELIPLKEVVFSGMFYFKNLTDILNFTSLCKKSLSGMIRSIEYFDSNSCKFIKKNITNDSEIVSYLPKKNEEILFIEFELTEKNIDFFYDKISENLKLSNNNLDNAFGGETGKEREVIKKIRHSLPESINQKIKRIKNKYPMIHKVGTDIAVPYEKVGNLISLYKNILEKYKFEYVIFGHIGDGHPHLNIIPKTAEEMDIAYKLYKEFAIKAVKWGGTVTAEHGVGKLKKDFLNIMYSNEVLEQMKNIRSFFDPLNMLGRGTMW